MPKPTDIEASPALNADGVLLLAKERGGTSFSALSCVKKALGTGKVGHTGTLDSFADGLLVVLAGCMTRLAPHLTALDKRYRAVIRFGSETDTLDPTGAVCETAPLPSEAAFRAALPCFVGAIRQTPPRYSAIHIAGRRASDLARTGAAAEMPERSVTVYALNAVGFSGKSAVLEVHCSKGTYIRSLARDIAYACGSRAYVAELRRTQVGPFALADAVPAGADAESLRAALRPMTAELARQCGFAPLLLADSRAAFFFNGRPLSPDWFAPLAAGKPADDDVGKNTGNFAVFTVNGSFAGVLHTDECGALRYGFVSAKMRPHKT